MSFPFKHLKHRLSLRAKLLFSYAMFLLLLITVAGLSYFFYQRQRSVAETVAHVSHLQNLFLQASRAEKHLYAYDLSDTTLYTTGTCPTLREHRQLSGQIRTQMRRLLHTPEVGQLQMLPVLARLEILWQSYDSTFAATIGLARRRGFKDYGEEGRMRTYAHALEEPGLPLPRESVLMLRRLEKDYIIRKDTAYAGRFFNWLGLLRTRYQNHGRVSNLLAFYEGGFRQLVRTDAQLGLTGYTGSRGEALRLSRLIEKQMVYVQARAEAETAAAQARMRDTLLLVVGLALVASTALGFGFAHGIARPVNHLMRHVDAIAAGRFATISAPIPVVSSDEVGALTDHINLMLGQIQEYLAEMQANAEQLTQQNDDLQRMNQRLADSEGRLRQMNMVKDRFFAIISHDLRGPLTSMLNFMQTFEEDAELFSPAELRLMTSRSTSSVRQMLELLDNLLSWALTHVDHIRYVPGPVSLPELVCKNGELLAASMAQKRLCLVLPWTGPASAEPAHDEPAGVMLWADRQMVDFILRNLLSNAIKFSHPGGVVRVAVRTTGEWVEITVTDTGVGMSEEALTAAFLLRSPLSTAGTLQEKGTGLGLITCHEFVRRHQGEIHARSKPGQGTCVTVRLPVYRSQHAASPAETLHEQLA